jgi:hypothetical protein
MPSPFPGMDPYLEDPRRWPGFHASMIAALRATLSPLVRPRYFVEIEERVVLYHPLEDERRAFAADVAVRQTARPAEATDATATQDAAATAVAEPPDSVIVQLPDTEEVTDSYIEIRRADDERVVTVVELLSPWNKQGGLGGAEYYEKRKTVLASDIHFIEVDLLRAGQRPPLQPAPPRPAAEYYVLVSRAQDRPQGVLQPIRLQQPLPQVTVPLLSPDPDVAVNLQHVFNRVYDEAGYDLVLRYDSDPIPPLSLELAAWADALLREKKLRKPQA